jgi:hypothetical protein
MEIVKAIHSKKVAAPKLQAVSPTVSDLLLQTPSLILLPLTFPVLCVFTIQASR